MVSWASFKFPPINLWNVWKTNEMQEILYNEELEDYFTWQD